MKTNTIAEIERKVEAHTEVSMKAFDKGFLLGKLEQLKSEKEFLDILDNGLYQLNNEFCYYKINERLSQIQKEIKEIEEKLR